jgi:hypothetical protein
MSSNIIMSDILWTLYSTSMLFACSPYLGIRGLKNSWSAFGKKTCTCFIIFCPVLVPAGVVGLIFTAPLYYLANGTFQTMMMID